MSILSGYGKYKRYILTNEGYKLCFQWTSSNTVEMGDGNTAETNLGSIKGITDSLTATSSNIALSASAGNNLQTQVDTLNRNLNNIEYGSFEEPAGWIFPTSNYICKKNGFVIINFAVQAINPLITGTWFPCKISSENFRPIKNISFTGNAHNQGSTRVPITFTIYTNGNIGFEIGSNNLSSIVDWFVFSGIYVV